MAAMSKKGGNGRDGNGRDIFSIQIKVREKPILNGSSRVKCLWHTKTKANL